MCIVVVMTSAREFTYNHVGVDSEYDEGEDALHYTQDWDEVDVHCFAVFDTREYVLVLFVL